MLDINWVCICVLTEFVLEPGAMVTVALFDPCERVKVPPKLSPLFAPENVSVPLAGLPKLAGVPTALPTMLVVAG